MRNRPTNSDDVIDSRDVEKAIDELESELLDAFSAGKDEVETAKFEAWVKEIAENGEHELANEALELDALRSLRSEAEGYSPDWKYGATLIRDDYFESYARDFADDIGAIKDNNDWPYTCIDWKQAAEELQQDYTSVEFDGVTYWVR